MQAYLILSQKDLLEAFIVWLCIVTVMLGWSFIIVLNVYSYRNIKTQYYSNTPYRLQISRIENPPITVLN
jgi:hypothetical protein